MEILLRSLPDSGVPILPLGKHDKEDHGSTERSSNTPADRVTRSIGGWPDPRPVHGREVSNTVDEGKGDTTLLATVKHGDCPREEDGNRGPDTGSTKAEEGILDILVLHCSTDDEAQGAHDTGSHDDVGLGLGAVGNVATSKGEDEGDSVDGNSHELGVASLVAHLESEGGNKVRDGAGALDEGVDEGKEPCTGVLAGVLEGLPVADVGLVGFAAADHEAADGERPLRVAEPLGGCWEVGNNEECDERDGDSGNAFLQVSNGRVR